MTTSDSFQPPLGSRAERVTYNEAWNRSLNERSAGWMRSSMRVAGFRCECGDPKCSVRLLLSRRDWERARGRPNRFAVAPGHVAADLETVLERRKRFWLVEKLGRAGELAQRLA